MIVLHQPLSFSPFISHCVIHQILRYIVSSGSYVCSPFIDSFVYIRQQQLQREQRDDNQPHTAMSTSGGRGENADQTEFLLPFFFLEHQTRIHPPAADSGDRMLVNEVIRQSILVVARHVDRSLLMESTISLTPLNALKDCVFVSDCWQTTFTIEGGRQTVLFVWKNNPNKRAGNKRGKPSQ